MKKIGDIWKCLRELNPKNSHCSPNLLENNGELAQTPIDIANTFNNFFLNLSKHLSFSDSDKSHTLQVLSQYTKRKLPENQQFTISPIEEDEVFSMLQKLNICKSAGIDALGPRILKLAAPVITKPITHLINISIKEAIFPDDLKMAKITPIYKKGERSDPGNYRPISILPTLSKIIEKHIASQLRDFLQSFDLLQKEQSGFRQHHSCQTALTKLTDMWLKEMDEGNLTGTIFLDFTKAFDLVDHKVLIQKLGLYNFDNYSLKWFTSYLKNRRQSVHIGNTQSENLEVISGVPQGSVLGPLLFLIYINDLPLHVEYSSIDIFADDATLHSSSPDTDIIHDKLTSDLNNIGQWCEENKMKIDEKKTNCMLIGTNQKLARLSCRELNLAINNHKLDTVESEKLLGVHFNRNLSFTKHVDFVCKNISSKIALLCRINQYLPLQARKLYFNSYILPVIDYCLTVWGNAPKLHIERIHKLQKRAARVILDSPPDSSSQPLFVELGWLTVFERVEYNKAILLYKSMNNMSPTYISSLFNFQNSEYYSLRSVENNNMAIPKHNTELFKNSFKYSGTKVWNALPITLRTACSLPAFKHNLYRHIISNRL